MKTTINLFISILFLNILSGISFAQENVTKTKPEHTFNLYFINGYAVSYNFYNAGIYYLRAQLDLSTSKEDLDTEGENVQDYPVARYERFTTGNSETDYFSIGVSAHIIFPVYKTNYGKIYVGAGPLFTYSNQNSSSTEDRKEFSSDTVSTPNSYNYSVSNNEKNYDLGVLVLVGLEAIITDNISLFAEANFKGGRRWQDAKWKNTNVYSPSDSYHYTDETNADGWFYQAQFMRLGVSISL